jgi:hypothetical protein
VEVETLLNTPVLPKLMAEFVLKSYNGGWPEKPLVVTDRPPNEVVNT